MKLDFDLDHILLRALCTGCLVALACGPDVTAEGGGTDGSTSNPMETTSETTVVGTTDDPTTETTTEPVDPATSSTSSTSSTSATTVGPGSDTGSSSTGAPGCVGDCPALMLDIVLVVDNSAGMGVAQRVLAESAAGLVDGLRTITDDLDARVMVTTTDFGNPLCTPFEPEGYDPAQGAPVSTPCLERLSHFTGLGVVPTDISSVCTDNCPEAVGPVDSFVAFDSTDDNVEPGDATAALSCLLPQGNVGCGYESPLENMLQALNPNACWNSPGGCTDDGQAFLRDEAKLAIVLVTNEYDCSVLDYSIMQDETYMNDNPDTGTPMASSAICWNAGVACDGPDANGVYSNCTATGGNGLHPTSRYTSYLVDELVQNQNKDVYMLGLFGIPSVTEHEAMPPYAPTAGGIADLEIRNWQNGEYPAGDILPDEWANGVTAEDKEFGFGVGPGCTGQYAPHGYTQAMPPVRMREVCEALDVQDGTHCCLESVCDEDYAAALQCLVGMVSTDLE